MPASSAAPSRRTRNDPRKEATRVAIIEAAETLFAENSLDSVSLRQIGAAIGSANKSVVAYHFGSKEALVEAIFHYRLPGIDARRMELLQEAKQNGREGDMYHLLKAVWLPLYEQVNQQGAHSFSGFLAAMMHSDMGDIRIALDTNYPVTTQLGKAVRQAMPKLLRTHFDSRMRIVTLMVTGTLKMIDHADSNRHARHGLSLFEDTLEMASAALFAPTRA